jgi:hypothetical protein
MTDRELSLHIDNLVAVIELEEENYRRALENNAAPAILQGLKEKLTNLKTDLEVFVDNEIIRKRGGLSNDNKRLTYKPSPFPMGIGCLIPSAATRLALSPMVTALWSIRPIV